ncbi:MAG: glycosyltransferase [Phreatobacter sp.]|nr:glycosyltransferase [Phreatobacter sp.]
MTLPLVSVVIPCYNRAQTIRRAIDSALAQELAEIEILVVDDGSADDSRGIVSAHPDFRVRLLARARNGGASAARNTGIAAARGEWVAFLDSDDLWLPGKLQRQLAAHATRPGPDVSCTGVEMHLLDHGVVRTQTCEDQADWAQRLAMGCDLSPGTTQMTRRAAFGRIGPLDESLPRFEDWDWLLRYTRSGAIIAVQEPLARVYNRRGRLGDMVALSAKRFAAKHHAVHDALAPGDRASALGDLWLQVVGTYAFEGRPMAALPYAWRAARLRPALTAKRLCVGAAAVLKGRLAARGSG